MKRFALSLAVVTILTAGAAAQTRSGLPKLPDRNLNFVVINDTGTSKEPHRTTVRQVAGHLAELAAANRMDFIAVAGDAIHEGGASGADDPQWQYKVEEVFSADALRQVPWYAVTGNHEYRANADAVVEYSSGSTWWNAPARYFAFEKKSAGVRRTKALFAFLDTTPLIAAQRSEFPDNCPEGFDVRELAWLDSTLMASRADWKIVFGHHPVFAHSVKLERERIEMQQRVGTLLESGGASLYVCGHIHNFQHLKPEGSTVHYVVNSSGVPARKVEPTEGTLFCLNSPGFSVYSVSRRQIDFYFIDKHGDVAYHYVIKR